MRRMNVVGTALLALLSSGCLGARPVQRNFFVLQIGTEPTRGTIRGLLRVRDLDAESVYERSQVVIRQSPYQLRYSGTNLWAVRPNAMVADIIGRSFQESQVFTAVTRELTEAKPDFTLAGELVALEVYDSGDLWYAHLALSLRLSRFRDGEQLWRFEFDERKEVGTTEVAHAVRAMSELLQVAIRRSMIALVDTVRDKTEPPPSGPGPGAFYQPPGLRPVKLEMKEGTVPSIPQRVRTATEAGRTLSPPEGGAEPFILEE